jgi:hypothetical protein
VQIATFCAIDDHLHVDEFVYSDSSDVGANQIAFDMPGQV